MGCSSSKHSVEEANPIDARLVRALKVAKKQRAKNGKSKEHKTFDQLLMKFPKMIAGFKKSRYTICCLFRTKQLCIYTTGRCNDAICNMLPAILPAVRVARSRARNLCFWASGSTSTSTCCRQSTLLAAKM